MTKHTLLDRFFSNSSIPQTKNSVHKYSKQTGVALAFRSNSPSSAPARIDLTHFDSPV